MPKSAQEKRQKKKKSGLKQEIIFFCSCCAAILILSLSVVNLIPVFQQNKVLGAKSETSPLSFQDEIQEISFWKNILSKNPTYSEGWLELARLSLQIGDKHEAVLAFEKAEEINPNSETLEQIRVLLGE